MLVLHQIPKFQKRARNPKCQKQNYIHGKDKPPPVIRCGRMCLSNAKLWCVHIPASGCDADQRREEKGRIIRPS